MNAGLEDMSGNTKSTDLLEIPHYPFKFIIFLGFTLWGLEALLKVFNAIKALRNEKRWDSMSLETIGLLGIAFMFILSVLPFPIAIAMAVPAFIGVIYVKGWDTLVAGIETIIWDHSFSYTLTTVPLFILMG